VLHKVRSRSDSANPKAYTIHYSVESIDLKRIETVVYEGNGCVPCDRTRRRRWARRRRRGGEGIRRWIASGSSDRIGWDLTRIRPNEIASNKGGSEGNAAGVLLSLKWSRTVEWSRDAREILVARGATSFIIHWDSYYGLWALLVSELGKICQWRQRSGPWYSFIRQVHEWKRRLYLLGPMWSLWSL
jgi:hypothetical protein